MGQGRENLGSKQAHTSGAGRGGTDSIRQASADTGARDLGQAKASGNGMEEG